MKKLFTIWFALMAFALCAWPEETNILLRTDIPRPPFMSQLISYNIPNLDPDKNWRHLPQLYVPVGTMNLALHKPVSASCPATVGSLDMVTDGDKAADDWLELKPGAQWVQIDLQQEAEIHGIWVWHYFEQYRVYFSVVAAISNDPEFKQDVKVVFNNDTNNVVGLGKGSDYNYYDTNFGRLIDAKGIKGRYVRLYSDGNNENKMNHYVEVEVFGLKANEASPPSPSREKQ